MNARTNRTDRKQRIPACGWQAGRTAWGLGLLLAGCLSASAETKTWTGTGNWNTPGNWSPFGVPDAADDALLASGICTLTDAVTVRTLTNQATLSFSCWNLPLTADNVAVLNAATVTHVANTASASPWTANAGVFIQCANVTVEVGGQVSVSELGYRGGTMNVSGRGPGRSTTAYYPGGAGHGGKGGEGYGLTPSGSTCGSRTEPNYPGSGAAGGGTASYIGGHGGGYVRIEASGAMTINGSVTANGGNAAGHAGAGAGGSIWLSCNTLSGTGLIYANGGNTAGNGGGGGGGRIAVSAATPTDFGGRISAKAGTSYYAFPSRWSTGVGTAHLSDWALLPEQLNSSGEAVFTASGGTAGNVTISDYTLFLVWGWADNRLKADTVTVQNTGKIRHTWNTASASPWTPNGGVCIECTDLTIEAGGQINVSELGYRGGTMNVSGYGPGRSTTAYYPGGAGHGGKGGEGYGLTAGGSTYGSRTEPDYPGSGAAGGGTASYIGGHGGGYVRIEASGSVTVDGSVTANGGNAAGHAAAGAGGGILLSCNTLSGTGLIYANGGNTAGNGGGGGGGRIAVSAAAPVSFGGRISAKAGTSYYAFPSRWATGVGTAHLSDWALLPEQLNGSGAAVFTASDGTAGNVTISDYTMFLAWGWDDNRLKAGTVTVRNTGKIRHMWNMASVSPWTPDAGVGIDCVNLTVEAGGQINVAELGYRGGTMNVSGYGPGRSTTAYYTGGAGHGGLGGNGYYGGAGQTYGSAVLPDYPGSGAAGGGTASYIGGHGGGYIRVTASRTITVDGSVTANGGNAAGHAGAGAGGGIYLVCRGLAGTGAVLANGGNAGGNGGGGGGGHIAYQYCTLAFDTNKITATGGSGYQAGGAGTVLGFYEPCMRGTFFTFR